MQEFSLFCKNAIFYVPLSINAWLFWFVCFCFSFSFLFFFFCWWVKWLSIIITQKFKKILNKKCTYINTYVRMHVILSKQLKILNFTPHTSKRNSLYTFSIMLSFSIVVSDNLIIISLSSFCLNKWTFKLFKPYFSYREMCAIHCTHWLITICIYTYKYMYT